MENENVGQAVELTNRIIEMVEGEDPKNLIEYIRLLEYHAGVKAGSLNGNIFFSKVISEKLIGGPSNVCSN